MIGFFACFRFSSIYSDKNFTDILARPAAG
jgi:hypothetical protein